MQNNVFQIVFMWHYKESSLLVKICKNMYDCVGNKNLENRKVITTKLTIFNISHLQMFYIK